MKDMTESKLINIKHYTTHCDKCGYNYSNDLDSCPMCEKISKHSDNINSQIKYEKNANSYK